MSCCKLFYLSLYILQTEEKLEIQNLQDLSCSYLYLALLLLGMIFVVSLQLFLVQGSLFRISESSATCLVPVPRVSFIESFLSEVLVETVHRFFGLPSGLLPSTCRFSSLLSTSQATQLSNKHSECVQWQDNDDCNNTREDTRTSF